MGLGHNFKKFVAAIVERSVASEWLEAKPEWVLNTVYDDPSPDRTCECGHSPINQICVIKNLDNENETEVGNVCVHNFMQLASRRIFAVLKRVEADPAKSLNPASLDLFAKRGAISADEADKYKIYWRKRKNLSDEERAQKTDINARVLRFRDEETKRLVANFRAKGLSPRGG